MHPAPSLPPKPVSDVWRPGLTRLPLLDFKQKIFRRIIRAFVRIIVSLFTNSVVLGLEKFPHEGPALVVINHLGDADGVLGIAYWPIFTDPLAKIELFDLPILGKIMDCYGVIWLHRGRPDRKALSTSLESLRLGRIVSIAPEGRESPLGALEGGTEGAAFIARKAGIPIVPVAITGTENWRIYGNMKKMRRTNVTMTVGDAFWLPEMPDRKTSLSEGTRLIMEALARLLPAEFRGVYSYMNNVQD